MGKIVAWAHNLREEVISAAVKETWLRFRPSQVDNYTIPLVTQADSISEKQTVYDNQQKKIYALSGRLNEILQIKGVRELVDKHDEKRGRSGE